ncbi:hypothetical protein C5B78_02585 [Aeromonas salmonicida]|uniref:hypothetical protein n=1 Tax=Aeromonas salmonicida TaxID=645 RepID=UPI000F79786A|nr:hypothetical protein [Aeromonas salmonicida]RSM31384.1 hypothetical protein C5B78_02585 [Aeromonas salmonicida]
MKPKTLEQITQEFMKTFAESQRYEDVMTLILTHEVDATHIPSSELAIALKVDHEILKEAIDDWEEDCDVEDNDYMLNIRLANRLAVRFNNVFADFIFKAAMQWRDGIYKFAKVNRHDMARSELKEWNENE